MRNSEWKTLASNKGLCWDSLKSLYNSLRSQKREALEPIWRVRTAVWQAYGKPGPKLLYPNAFNGESDLDSIPSWDCLATCIFNEERWLANEESEAARALYEIVAMPEPKMESTTDTWLEAMDLLEAGTKLAASNDDNTAQLEEGF
jgi:hypothetical protein